jgi:hypothetical protein
MKTLLTAAAVAAAASLATAGNVTPGVIFGSGNANGSFTIASGSNMELGLRAKLRYNSAGNPENTFNQVGTSNTYSFDPADGNAPGNRAFWNFEWSINTNLDGTGQNALNAFTYQIALFKVNADGTNTADALTFDPINQTYADHAMGTNATTAATKVIAANASQYATNISTLNVAQNSWNYDFFDGQAGTALENWNPNVAGTYIIRLTAFDSAGAEVLSNSINVHVVPLPPAAWAGLATLGAAFGVRKLRRR